MPNSRDTDAAISAAEAVGYIVERLISHDRPDAATRGFVALDNLRAWRQTDHVTMIGVREQCARLRSPDRYMEFLDADYLCGEYWLAPGAWMLANAECDGCCVIVHQEINWIFNRDAPILVEIQ